jgi:hypothetical protein
MPTDPREEAPIISLHDPRLSSQPGRLPGRQRRDFTNSRTSPPRPRQDQIKLGLPQALYESVLAYHQLVLASMPDQTLQDSVRELIQLGLSLMPEEAVLLSAREATYRTMKTWVNKRLADLLSDLALECSKLDL